MLNPAQIALARSRAYSLFSRLALNGLTPEILPAIQALPDLAENIVFQPDMMNWGDEAAAAHHCVFGLGVFPYQSVFLSADGLLGGAENARVLTSYARVGFVCGDADAGEHLGWQLACLAFLCGVEADAWEDSQLQRAEQASCLQREFLAVHLLRWLPPLVSALRCQGDRFYAAFADLLLSLAADHMAAGTDSQPVGAARKTDSPQRTQRNTEDNGRELGSSALNFHRYGWQLKGTNLALEEKKTDLQEIARWLTKPPNSGFFLSREEIGRLARMCDLPTSFGDRDQMLGALLHTAAHFGRFSALCVALGNVIGRHRDTYNTLESELPVLSPWVTPWRERVCAAAGLVEQLGAAG